MRTQAALVAGGALVTAYGVWLLLATGWENVVAAGVWLAGGVLAHDAILAPLTILVVWLALRMLPASVRARAAAAFVVVGTVTVVAIPVLGRFGAREDNPTLLPRDYVGGWLLAIGLVLLVSLGLGLLDRSRATRPDPSIARNGPLDRPK